MGTMGQVVFLKIIFNVIPNIIYTLVANANLIKAISAESKSPPPLLPCLHSPLSVPHACASPLLTRERKGGDDARLT